MMMMYLHRPPQHSPPPPYTTQVFVARNIANLVVNTDMSLLAVLEYSIHVLEVSGSGGLFFSFLFFSTTKKKYYLVYIHFFFFRLNIRIIWYGIYTCSFDLTHSSPPSCIKNQNR